MLEPYVILNAVTANTVGKKIYCKDYKTIIIAVASNGLSGGGSFIVNFKGSIEESAPNFSAARSITNIWDYVQAVKQTDGTNVDGVTGDTFTADDVRLYEVNVDGLSWVTVDLNSLVGTVTAVTAKGNLYEQKN